MRLTRRGRLVVTLVLTAMIVAAFVVFGGASVATRDAGAPEQVRVIEVEQGQTLWGIASQASGDGDVREMVYRIRELNSLPDSSLVEGQELADPAGLSPGGPTVSRRSPRPGPAVQQRRGGALGQPGRAPGR